MAGIRAVSGPLASRPPWVPQAGSCRNTSKRSLVFSILGYVRLICRSGPRGRPGCWAPAPARYARLCGCPTGTVVGPRGRLAVRGRSGVLVATVLPYVLNGYMSIEARMRASECDRARAHRQPPRLAHVVKLIWVMSVEDAAIALLPVRHVIASFVWGLLLFRSRTRRVQSNGLETASILRESGWQSCL